MRLKTLIRENCANINNGYGVDTPYTKYSILVSQSAPTNAYD
jgi:hypothetical protein